MNAPAGSVCDLPCESPALPQLHPPSSCSSVVRTSTDRNLLQQQLFQQLLLRLPVFLRRPCVVHDALDALSQRLTSPTSMLARFRPEWNVQGHAMLRQPTRCDEERTEVATIFLVGSRSFAAPGRSPRCRNFRGRATRGSFVRISSPSVCSSSSATNWKMEGKRAQIKTRSETGRKPRRRRWTEQKRRMHERRGGSMESGKKQCAGAWSPS